MTTKCAIHICRRREDNSCCAECGDKSCNERCTNSPDQCGYANAKAYKPKEKRPQSGVKQVQLRLKSRAYRFPSDMRAKILWLLIHRDGSTLDIADHFGVSNGAIDYRKGQLRTFRLQCQEESYPPHICKNGDCRTFNIPICCHSCPVADCPRRCQSNPRSCLRVLLESEVEKVPRRHYPKLSEKQRAEIITLLQAGLTNKEIAKRFDVTPSAIGFYRKKLARGEICE